MLFTKRAFFNREQVGILCILAGYIDLELVFELIKCCVEQPLIFFHTDSLDPKRFFNLGLFYKDVILPEISYAVLNISFENPTDCAALYKFIDLSWHFTCNILHFIDGHSVAQLWLMALPLECYTLSMRNTFYLT